MTFSTKISLLIAGIFLVSFSVMAYLGFSSSTRMLEQQIRENLEHHAVHSMDKIDRLLSERQADMGILRTDEVIASRSSSPQQITARLAAFQRDNGASSFLSFFDLNRVRIADTAGREIGKRDAAAGYWQAIATGRDFVMTVAESRILQRPVIFIAALVRDAEGAPFGVVVSRTPLERIYEITEQAIAPGEGGRIGKVELLDRNGMILYSSYNARGVLKGRSEDWPIIEELLSDGRMVGSARHDYAGEEEITAFAREQGHGTFTGSGWMLVLCTPVKTAFAPAFKQSRTFLVLFAAILLISLPAVFLLSRAALRPLKRLSAAAFEIGKGNLDVSVDVTSDDEIGGLARAFNDMVRNLSEKSKMLSESEEKLRKITDTVQDAIIMMDAEGNTSFWNPAAEKTFGYRSGEVMGKGLHVLIGPQKYEDAFRRGFALFQQTGTGHAVGRKLELRGVRKDGNEIDIELSLSAMQIKKQWHAVAIIRDITQRKQAEEALRDSEARFRVLAEKSPNMIFINKKGRVVYANPRCEEIMGYARDEFYAPDFNFLTLIAPEYHETLATIFQKQMQGEDKPAFEYALMSKEGRRIEAIISTKVITFDGEPSVLGVITDITERKQHEKKIQQLYGELEKKVEERTAALMETTRSLQVSESKLMTIFNTAADGIALVDAETKQFSEVNDMFCRMLGYSREELLHLTVPDVHAENDLPYVMDQFVKLIHESSKMVMEVPFKRKDGSVLFTDINGCPIVLEGRKYLMGIIRDISERKRLEEQLVRNEKLSILGQMAGSVGHELRNPLGVISNAVFYLKTVLRNADETVAEYLNIIKSEVDTSHRIISDLLDFSRTRPPHTEATALTPIIEKSIGACAVPSEVAVVTDIPESVPPVRTDPLQMGQVFQNLIANAVQAMPGGGRLHVSALHEQGADIVTVTVKDTGDGIPADRLFKLFQPLYTTKSRGIGLGLTVAKRNVEANGGTITVASEPGKGTTFTVRLPVAA